jgi:hypothetical protein
VKARDPMRPRRRATVEGRTIFFTDRALDAYREHGVQDLSSALAGARIEPQVPPFVKLSPGKSREALMLTDGSCFVLRRRGAKHANASFYMCPPRDKNLRRGFR